MSYKSEFASNNADLQTVLDMVNALPDAGSGAKVDTCTVVLQHSSSNAANAWWYCATRYVDGEFIPAYTVYYTTPAACPITITDVVCGSPIFLRNMESEIFDLDITSTYGSTAVSSPGACHMVVTITSTPNVSETITLIVDTD